MSSLEESTTFDADCRENFAIMRESCNSMFFMVRGRPILRIMLTWDLQNPTDIFFSAVPLSPVSGNLVSFTLHVLSENKGGGWMRTCPVQKQTTTSNAAS